MPVTTVVIVIVLAGVLVEAVVRKRSRRTGWLHFGSWAVAGFLSALASISFAIGLLVLPLAVIAILVASRLSVWPAALGFVSGAGLTAVLVGALNVGEGSSADYSGWLIVGSVLSVAAAAAFRVLAPNRPPVNRRV